MAAGNVHRVIRGPGRLVAAPTQSFETGTYPYGGTEVGKSNLCAVASLGDPFPVMSEGTGQINDLLSPPPQYEFSCFLRGWDDDAVEQILGYSEAEGSLSQHRLLDEPGDYFAGTSAIARALKLVYVPDDPIHVPGVMMFNAIPYWGRQSQIFWDRGEELGIPVTCHLLPTDAAAASVIQIGRMKDLSLT